MCGDQPSHACAVAVEITLPDSVSAWNYVCSWKEIPLQVRVWCHSGVWNGYSYSLALADPMCINGIQITQMPLVAPHSGCAIGLGISMRCRRVAHSRRWGEDCR